MQQHRLKRGDRPVTIRVDHEDLSEIAVLLDDSWVAVRAVDQQAASTTLAQLQLENELLNREHAAQAAVSAPVVARARQRMREMNKHAMARARLAPFGDGEKMLRATRRELLLSFRTIDAPASAIRDLGGEIPATGREPDRPEETEAPRASTSSTTVSRRQTKTTTTRSPRDWKIED